MKQKNKRGGKAGHARSPAQIRAKRGWLVVAVLVAGVSVLAIKFGASKRPALKPDVAAHTPPESVSTSLAATATASTEPPGIDAESDAQDTDRAVEYLNRGTELLSKGKAEAAAALYAEAVKLTPEDEDAHYNLALALARLGKLEEARKHYEEALRIFPDYSEAHNNLGTALARQGKVALAIVHFDQAVRLQPNYVEARYNLGIGYLSQDRVEAAIEQLTVVLRLQPDFEPAQRSLANARQKQTLARPQR